MITEVSTAQQQVIAGGFYETIPTSNFRKSMFPSGHWRASALITGQMRRETHIIPDRKPIASEPVKGHGIRRL